MKSNLKSVKLIRKIAYKKKLEGNYNNENWCMIEISIIIIIIIIIGITTIIIIVTIIIVKIIAILMNKDSINKQYFLTKNKHCIKV